MPTILNEWNLNEINTLEDLKKQYKKLVLKNHPDRGGSHEKMVKINNDYEQLFQDFKNKFVNISGEFYETENNEAPEYFKDLLNSLVGFQDIEIEIIGSFVWITGNTREIKEQLKNLGFRWSSNKKAWYKAPADYKKRSRKNYSLDDLRNTYGSSKVAKTTRKQLEKVS